MVCVGPARRKQNLARTHTHKMLHGGLNPFEEYARPIGSFPEKSGWKSYLSCHHRVTVWNTQVFNSLNSDLILPHKAQLKPNLEVSMHSGEPGTPDTTPSLRRNWWPVGHREIPPWWVKKSQRLVHEVGGLFWPFWQIYLVDLVVDHIPFS